MHIMASLDGRPTIFGGSGNVTGKTGNGKTGMTETGMISIEQFDIVRDRWHEIPIKLPYEIYAADGVGNIPLDILKEC